MEQNLCGWQLANSYQVSRCTFPLTQKPHCGDTPTLVLPSGQRGCTCVGHKKTLVNNLSAQQKGTKENTRLAQCLAKE